MTAGMAHRLALAGYDWIAPVWETPPNVHALSTSRNGGVSVGARASLDLGAAIPVQDAEHIAVLENRRRLAQFLPAAPVWLSQVHAADIALVDRANMASLLSSPPTADAAVTRAPGVVLGVRTADCLPVLFADRAGTVIGAAHAGWRGLAAGVLEETLRAMHAPPREIVAWLGPAIGPQKFEVGADVFATFCGPDPGAAAYFAPHRDGQRLAADRDVNRLAADRDANRLAADRDDKWLADLYGLARHRLQRAGISAVAGGGHCTMTEAGRFFSWRRDKDAGRMATLIWLGPGA